MCLTTDTYTSVATTPAFRGSRPAIGPQNTPPPRAAAISPFPSVYLTVVLTTDTSPSVPTTPTFRGSRPAIGPQNTPPPRAAAISPVPAEYLGCSQSACRETGENTTAAKSREDAPAFP